MDKRLGRNMYKCLINGLESQSLKIYKAGREEIDLTQTSYSEIPTVDIELGNQCTVFSAENLEKRAKGIFSGIENYFSQIEA